MAANGQEEFDSDPRMLCKYGISCYQRNKIHHEKYKHPSCSPELKTNSPEMPTKKQKLNLFDPETSNSPPSIKGKMLSTPPPKKLPDLKQTEKNDVSTERVLLKDKPRSSDSKRVELDEDHKGLIKQLFLSEMPDDFYSFWEMCKSMNNTDPTNALKAIKLKLVGPFDVLAGKITDVYEDDLPEFLKHWRYYYDPPEFQTVLASPGDAQCFHMGYYRDDPKNKPVFVASNALNLKNPEKNGELKVVGPNLFAALNSYLEDLKTDPFSRMRIPQIQKTLSTWAKDKGFSLEKSSRAMTERSRKVVAKTFHGAGIVVPVDKERDVGYRELAAPNSMIKRMLKGIVEGNEEESRKCWEQLQPVITFANIANDECDFGTSLELGLDLFSYGSPQLHRSAKQLLTTAYNLLERTEFAKIIEVHLEDRRKGNKLSVL